MGMDPLLREMIASLLADLPMEVQTTSSVGRFEKQCKSGCFDLVIVLDITLFFDGSEPVSSLRPAGLQIPKFFVISWQHSERVVMGLLECGVSQYITLPVNVCRLRRKICETLDCNI